MNLSPKTTCLERPYFGDQLGGLSRQIPLYCNKRILDPVLGDTNLQRLCLLVTVPAFAVATKKIPAFVFVNDKDFQCLVLPCLLLILPNLDCFTDIKFVPC